MHRRRGGQRSRQEAFIWWTWSAFLVASSLWALLNATAGRPIATYVVAIPLLAAMSWAGMAAAVHAGFAAAAIAFALAAVVMHLVPDWQFVIYGVCWFVTLLGLGLHFRPRGLSEGRAL